jgi:hypothetical protein
VADEGLDLPGIGKKLSTRLERNLGGPEGVREALEEGDVARLASVPGISRSRAVDMVKAYRGDARDWLRTDDADRLARQALEPFLDRAVTSLGRARLETLAPAGDRDRLDERLDAARRWRERLDGEDLDAVADVLGDVERPSQPRPDPQRDVAVLVDPDSPLTERLRDQELDRWVDVADGTDGLTERGLVLAATTGRTPPGAVQVPADEPWQVVPWADLAWAEANHGVLEALAELADLLEADDHARPVLDALDEREAHEPVDLEAAAKDAVEAANEGVEERIEDVTLSGEDVLEVLQGGTSQTVEELVAEARSDARERFQDATGLVASPFSDEYPLEVDRRRLTELEEEQRQDRALNRFRAAQDVARQVRAHRDGVERMVREAVELDRWQAVGRASRELDLSVAEVGDRFTVQGALHLDLVGEGQPVDYPVPNGVALLTGANSGGKTTLIETLAQVAWLAHLGLPVPADEAQVPLLDGLAFYERPRQLGAGAFEGFLRTIEDVLLSEERVLVLADELEAMTELEAASAILAEVVDRLRDRSAPAVLVTHLAPYILDHVEVRTDGIEAKGLDEDDELVVDRTPKVGTVARSTPELILQRLRNTAEDERRDLYASMLDRLDSED